MFQIISFFYYWLKRVDQHSLHSPFVFNFFNEVIRDLPEKDKDIEALKFALTHNKTAIEVQDYGAGSRVSKNSTRSIGSIAKYASTPSKFSRFLLKAIRHLDYQEIIELGTSLGLNTLYLSKAEHANITTFEGDPSIADLAKQHFGERQRTNIDIIVGNIDHTLPEHLKSSKTIDMVYIDANHRFEPTLRYYELILPHLSKTGMVVIDDIHWSKEMNNAWEQIKERSEVTLSLDLFEAGILFFDPKIQKADYILKF